MRRKDRNRRACGALLAASLFLGGCMERLDPPPFAISGIVDYPPDSNVGPPVSFRGWRTITFDMKKQVVRRAYNRGYTFAAWFTNCGPEQPPDNQLPDPSFVWISSLYLGDDSLYQSDLPASEFNVTYSALPAVARVSAYVPEAIFQEHERVCATIKGGTW
jgi:hypothetical protein